MRSVPPIASDKIEIRTDDELEKVLTRAAPRNRSAYIRAAIHEKAARDEQQGELDDIRRRVARLERTLGLKPYQ